MTRVDTLAPRLGTLARESFLEEVTLEPDLHIFVCAASIYSSKFYQSFFNASLSECPLLPSSAVLHCEESLLMGLAGRRSAVPGRVAGIVRAPEKPGNT